MAYANALNNVEYKDLDLAVEHVLKYGSEENLIQLIRAYKSKPYTDVNAAILSRLESDYRASLENYSWSEVVKSAPADFKDLTQSLQEIGYESFLFSGASLVTPIHALRKHMRALGMLVMIPNHTFWYYCLACVSVGRSVVFFKSSSDNALLLAGDIEEGGALVSSAGTSNKAEIVLQYNQPEDTLVFSFNGSNKEPIVISAALFQAVLDASFINNPASTRISIGNIRKNSIIDLNTKSTVQVAGSDYVIQIPHTGLSVARKKVISSGSEFGDRSFSMEFTYGHLMVEWLNNPNFFESEDFIRGISRMIASRVHFFVKSLPAPFLKDKNYKEVSTFPDSWADFSHCDNFLLGVK